MQFSMAESKVNIEQCYLTFKKNLHFFSVGDFRIKIIDFKNDFAFI